MTGSNLGQGGQVLSTAHAPHQAGTRTRSRSPQVKRNHDGQEIDEDGYRRQGRPRHQRRPLTSGASKVAVDDVGELHPPLQYYIGNTPGKADETLIRKVLERCAVPLLDTAEGPLLLTRYNF